MLRKIGLIYDDMPGFLEVYEFEDKNVFDQVVAMTYFSFTTLSTVGFGDYHPKSNIERILGIFVFLVGAGASGFLVQNLKDIIMKYQSVLADFE